MVPSISSTKFSKSIGVYEKSALGYSRVVGPTPSPKVPTLARDPVHIPKAAVVVARRIRRGIMHGEFQPGQALPNETELMALYEVSRPVVREALRILESEALIKVKRGVGGGARVRTTRHRRRRPDTPPSCSSWTTPRSRTSSRRGA